MADDEKEPEEKATTSKKGGGGLGGIARDVDKKARMLDGLKNDSLYRDLEKTSRALMAAQRSIIPRPPPQAQMEMPRIEVDNIGQRQVDQLITLTDVVVAVNENTRDLRNEVETGSRKTFRLNVAILVVAVLSVLLTGAGLYFSINQ